MDKNTTIAVVRPPRPSLKDALERLLPMPEFTVFLEEASALAFEPLNRTLDSSHDHDVLMDAQGAKRAVRRFTDMKKLLENLKRKDHAE